MVSQPDDEPTPASAPTPAMAADTATQPPTRARRPGRARTVLLLVLAGILSLGAGAAIGQATQPAPPSVPVAVPSAPTSALRTTPDAAEQRAMSLTSLLAARSKAVLGRDKDAWLATVDPQASDFLAKQAQAFDNLRDVKFSAFGYEFAGVAPSLTDDRREALGGDAWVARVVATYRLADVHRAPTQSDVFFTSVQRDGRWYIAADTDGQSTPQPWDLGRVRVVRGDHVLALGTADAEDLASYADQGDAAVKRVSKVWGTRWPQSAVLVVPRNEDEMGKLLGRSDGLDQIAAVTTGEIAGSDSAGSDRVVINPSAFSKLGAAGRRVVLTHEMTHVAVRASTTVSVPIWLSEGFADYVGYQGVELARRTVAADVLALVRQGEGPTQLPTAEDFDPAQTTIAPSYSAAWLACSLIADRYGQAKLVALYRTAASNPSDDPDTALTQAFKTVLGTSDRAFATSWLAYLKTLAAAG